MFFISHGCLCQRKAEGLTQRELAKKLGISLDTLTKIKKGHKKGRRIL
ncbi:XRE family transcriptional regulator [Rhodococcus qingshengii]|nr:XRE family transcriptional regulator [Rhodococcus qingshengii]